MDTGMVERREGSGVMCEFARSGGDGLGHTTSGTMSSPRRIAARNDDGNPAVTLIAICTLVLLVVCPLLVSDVFHGVRTCRFAGSRRISLAIDNKVNLSICIRHSTMSIRRGIILSHLIQSLQLSVSG